MGKRNHFFSLILLLVCLVEFGACKSEKSILVGFCNVPEKTQSAIKEYFAESAECKIKYDQVIIQDEKSAKKIAAKYDLIFAWNGKVPGLLESFAQKDELNLRDFYPTSIENSSSALPVLLDHYGISYSLSGKSKLKYRYPGSLSEFEKTFKKFAEKVDYPLFVAGKDDSYFLAFLGCFCESFGGRGGYEAFLGALENFSDMKNFLATPISDKDTIESVLLNVLDWQQKKILAKDWLLASSNDFKVLSKDEKIISAFISLSDFHSLDYEIAKNFVSDRFPVKNQHLAHSLVAPVLVCVNVSRKNISKNLYEKLITPECQTYLSKHSALAPAANLGQAYDKQADDVRFLAAACLGGPVVDAKRAVFEFDSEKMAVICDELRAYLKK